MYSLHLIELKECSFTKADDYYPGSDHVEEGDSSEQEKAPERQQSMEVGTYYLPNDNYLWVGVTVKVLVTEKEQELLSIFVNMRGLFEAMDDPALTMETFGQINGPAIIFPFVREQLANLTMKANIPPILLPPINFVKRAKEEGE